MHWQEAALLDRNTNDFLGMPYANLLCKSKMLRSQHCENQASRPVRKLDSEKSNFSESVLWLDFRNILKLDFRKLDDLRGKILRKFPFVKLTWNNFTQLNGDNAWMWIVNQVNITNIKQIVLEQFSENLIRGRGLFAKSIMKAQAASLPFTPVFAALVASINTKLPQVGELVLTRIISQFTRKSFKRNNKVGVVFLVISHFFCSLLKKFSLLDRLSFHDHLPRPSRQPISCA